MSAKLTNCARAARPINSFNALSPHILYLGVKAQRYQPASHVTDRAADASSNHPGRSRVNRTGNDTCSHVRKQRRIATTPDYTCTKAIDNVAADRATGIAGGFAC